SVQLLLDELFQLPQPDQVGHCTVRLLLAVENLLAIQIHFKPAIRARGQGDRYITTESTEELVRHPRGGRVMFSTDTVQDVDQRFPLSHRYPPSYELASHPSQSTWQYAQRYCTRSCEDVKRLEAFVIARRSALTPHPPACTIWALSWQLRFPCHPTWACGWSTVTRAGNAGDTHEHCHELAGEVCGDDGLRGAIRGGPAADQGKCTHHHGTGP